MGLTWKDLGSIENAEEFLNQSGDALLRLIKKEKEYVADFSIQTVRARRGTSSSMPAGMSRGATISIVTTGAQSVLSQNNHLDFLREGFIF